jgi:hypothetical protein
MTYNRENYSLLDKRVIITQRFHQIEYLIEGYFMLIYSPDKIKGQDNID